MPEAPDPADSPTAEQLAEREWPTLRARLVDVAAALDRIDRLGDSPPAAAARTDAERMLREILEPGESDRAERVLTMLSRRYDKAWRERFAAGETSPDTPSTEG
ncbi:hypothetical protein MalM25_16140 [Planctomycetes bacterium MalM25]|nr:hypothetical protein MalM25_16140 [Planctomycetes bacterium MalM25]